MAVLLSVQLEMTHILSSTTIISLVYSKMCFCNQFTGALWFFRGGKMVRNSQNSLESSSEMAVQVSVQLEMTHILSNTNNMSIVYTYGFSYVVI